MSGWNRVETVEPTKAFATPLCTMDSLLGWRYFAPHVNPYTWFDPLAVHSPGGGSGISVTHDRCHSFGHGPTHSIPSGIPEHSVYSVCEWRCYKRIRHIHGQRNENEPTRDDDLCSGGHWPCSDLLRAQSDKRSSQGHWKPQEWPWLVLYGSHLLNTIMCCY